MKIFLSLIVVSCSLPTLAMASQPPFIAPYKDSLFNYSKTLETADQGAFELKDYDEMRDVNGRDSIPVKRAKDEYVNQQIIGTEKDRTLKTSQVGVEYFVTGSERGAVFAVIFAHGGGGTKELGMKDWTFGGNFNRLKYFALQHNGAYYSPTFTDFGTVGAAQIKLLVAHIRQVSPKARIILACASSGGGICAGAFLDDDVRGEISGMILMSTGSAGLLSSPKMKTFRGAMLIQHGQNDRLVSWEPAYQVFRGYKSSHLQSPVRFQLFKNGGHGTPIRMIDWRETLNWMLQ